MNVFRFLTILFLSLAFSSCSKFTYKPGKFDPYAGLYSRRVAWDGESLTLKEDSTFQYRYRTDIGGTSITGFYDVRNDTIILDDDFRIEYIDIFRVREKRDTDKTTKTIRFVDFKGENLRLPVELYFNTDSNNVYSNKYLYRYSSKSKIPTYLYKEIMVDSIESITPIRIITFKINMLEFEYELMDALANEITIFMDQTNREIRESSRFRKKKKWLFRGDRVYLLDAQDQPGEKRCLIRKGGC